MFRLQIVPKAVLFAALAFAAACDSSDNSAPRAASTVALSFELDSVEVGQATIASAAALDQRGDTIFGARPTFSSSTPAVAEVDAFTGVISPIAAGTAQINATFNSKTTTRSIRVAASPIRINEVKPNADAPTGWVELVNPSTSEISLAGWKIASTDLESTFTIPDGTTLAAGGHLVIDEVNFPLGLKPVDNVHLFSKFGAQVDAFGWLANPVNSFSRCPDGTGAFVTTLTFTRGNPNVCPAPAADAGVASNIFHK